jgi:hypothetical protein
MLVAMPGIIDGRKWVEERLRNLHAMLDANPAEDDRTAIQAEIDRLRTQAESNRRRHRRWLLWGGRPPQL